ncbi:MAG TPA: peroxiredoxin, partial [Rhodanobacteraceae bacterium]|nr:peroxiredoxin [Rhodanobacteraceae bacterium]
MKRLIPSLFVLILAALFAAPLAAEEAAPAAGPTDGQAAPEFRLEDQKGNWHTLGQYSGKWV